MFSLQNVSKTFGGKSVLSQLSWNIQPGSINILVGPSGCGKSTLLRIISKLDLADSGQMISSKKTAYVSQNFGLFKHLSVKANLMLVLRKVQKLSAQSANARADELLNQFELQEHAADSVLTLSGGQKQRLAIARALAVCPDLLCLDEPSSALDPELTAKLAHILKTLHAEGYTIVLTTHDSKLLELLPGANVVSLDSTGLHPKP